METHSKNTGFGGLSRRRCLAIWNSAAWRASKGGKSEDSIAWEAVTAGKSENSLAWEAPTGGKSEHSLAWGAPTGGKVKILSLGSPHGGKVKIPSLGKPPPGGKSENSLAWEASTGGKSENCLAWEAPIGSIVEHDVFDRFYGDKSVKYRALFYSFALDAADMSNSCGKKHIFSPLKKYSRTQQLCMSILLCCSAPHIPHHP